MRRFATGLVLLLVTGCGNGAKDEMIPLDKVPESMLKTAREKLPDVRFENAIKHGDGSYEVRGKDPKGKVRDVEFSATGEVTEIE